MTRPEQRLATFLLYVSPAFFAANMVTARAVAEAMPPVGLALWRWTAAFAMLAPFVATALYRRRAVLRAEAGDLLVLGTLAVGVCGAFVYVGAATTAAVNIALIYAISPILIGLIMRFRYGETMSRAQELGVALAFLGVLTIAFRGDFAAALLVRFVVGDLWILGASVGWAIYSVMLKQRPSALPPMPRFAAICAAGVLTLLPFAAAEAALDRSPALDFATVGAVLFLAVVPSIGGLVSNGYIQRKLGATQAGMVIYLAPIYAAALAALLLGEPILPYHLAGGALVLAGLFLATRRHG